MQNQKAEFIEQEHAEVETFRENENGNSDLLRQEETGITTSYLDKLEYVSKNIDRFIAAKEKIWLAILKIAQEGDWVVFSSPDKKKETVCCSGPGAERIATTIGVSFTGWKEKKEVWEDKKGQAYRYWFECDASFSGRTIRAIGRASSRDKFFGKAHGQLKELTDIPEDDIRMAAFRGAMKEGVRLLLGLRNIPKSVFEKSNTPLVHASAYSFQKPGDGVQQQNLSPSEMAEQGLVCSSCAAVVSDKIRDYSKANFGKTLCFDCQKKEKK